MIPGFLKTKKHGSSVGVSIGRVPFSSFIFVLSKGMLHEYTGFLFEKIIIEWLNQWRMWAGPAGRLHIGWPVRAVIAGCSAGQVQSRFLWVSCKIFQWNFCLYRKKINIHLKFHFPLASMTKNVLRRKFQSDFLNIQQHPLIITIH